ncbi:MAG: tetratricopeptide repeat protein [Bryobacterales bacterium]|nr:tetratricopeptide repeat protein [Bryobacterales bacterium]
MNGRITPAERVDLAETLWDSGRAEEALATLAGSETVDAQVYALRGEIEFALGRFQEAALSFTALVTAEPDCGDGHYNLGLALLRTAKWEGAASALQRALRLDRNRPDAWAALGVCLLESQMPAEALTAFERSRTHGIAGKAPWAQACLGRATALHLLSRFEEARSAYENLLESDPAHPDVIQNLIALAAAAGDLQALTHYSQRLLALDPHSIAALQGLASVALYHGDFQSLARYCDQIMVLAPGSLEAQHNFSVATERLLAGIRGAGFNGAPFAASPTADPSAAGGK